MRNDLQNDKEQDLSDELGHLYLGPQSKSRYVSPDFFAMISLEVGLLHSILVESPLTLHRLQKSIICSSSNSNTLLTPSFMFEQMTQMTHYKLDHIVGALSALMTRGLIARPLQDNSAAIFSPCRRHGH